MSRISPRKIVLTLAATSLPALMLVAVQSGAAQAVSNPTNLPGTVTCSPSGGVWSGTVTFAPPLMTGGNANTETLVVTAILGNTASPCVTNTGIVVLGKIKGKLVFNIPGTANNCATVFSGVTLPTPAAGNFKMTWTTPAGSTPTKWAQPSGFPFKVKGAVGLNNISIKGGKVAGSFTPFAAPKAVLSDANWPGAAGAVSTGCASVGGLSSLTLSTSAGKW